MGSQIIATKVISPLVVPIKVAFYMSVFISMPVLFYQLWAFIAPALYYKEKYLLAPLLVISSALFFAGVLFAYYIACPIAFKFFISALPAHVTMMTDINDYLSFLMQLMFAFGFCFEVPVIIFLVYYMGFLNEYTVKKIRPYVIVIAFILGMLLTPPDVVSQIMLAIPLWLFFELGILLARLVLRKQRLK
jgi:sec-independent protein translocase protein TatC